MRKLLMIFLCVGLFGAGLAVGHEEERSASVWTSRSEMEKLMYTNGYLQGFVRGKIYVEIATSGLTSDGKKIDPARLARLKVELRDQAGTGANKNMDTAQIKDVITAFYGDFRNQGVCWPDAFKFATMALRGDTPTEDELQVARKSDAQTGCE